MYDKFGRTIGPKAEMGRAVDQVTHRDLKHYLDLFALSENDLIFQKNVIDIGAGFSSFSEEAREKIKNLNVVAIDPIYSSIIQNPDLVFDEFKKSEDIIIDFDPAYQGKKESPDLDSANAQAKAIYYHFVGEVRDHLSNYLAGSHQQLPPEVPQADLVLASNSIVREENSPVVIDKALRECLRVSNNHGEIRIGGAMNCFVFNPDSGNAELWHNGALVPDSPQSLEFQNTGHYSDPELFKVFADLERGGAKFYCVILVSSADGEVRHRFHTLILRKDEKIPSVAEIPDSEKETYKLMKMHFQKSDGFNIPVDAK